MEYQGVTYVSHCLDDYITVGPWDTSFCSVNFDIMLRVCNDLGFSVNPNKVVYPTIKLEFFRITLDSSSMEASISNERLANMMEALAKWKDRSCTTS